MSVAGVYRQILYLHGAWLSLWWREVEKNVNGEFQRHERWFVILDVLFLGSHEIYSQGGGRLFIVDTWVLKMVPITADAMDFAVVCLK